MKPKEMRQLFFAELLSGLLVGLIVAIGVRALERSPNEPDLLFGLAAFSREAGRLPDARDYAERLAAVAPHDERAQPLLRELGGNY